MTEQSATSSRTSSSKRSRVHGPGRVHGEQSLLGAFGRRLVHGAEHGFVLDRRGDDRARPAALARRPPGAEYGEIVAFGSAGRETDLVGVGAETGGDALARLVERCPRLAPPPVHTRRIAEARPEERAHRVEDLGAHRRRRRMVEIDGGRHT